MKGLETQRVFLMSSCYNPGQKSLGQYCNIHFFLSFLASLLKQCILFEIFLQFSLPAPYTKLKLGKNSGYTRPTLFVGWGEGLDLCELENAPETQKCHKTFVHDCSCKTDIKQHPMDKVVLARWSRYISFLREYAFGTSSLRTWSSLHFIRSKYYRKQRAGKKDNLPSCSQLKKLLEDLLSVRMRYL